MNSKAAVLTLLLAGCSPAPVAGFCPAVVHPDDRTRAWLGTLTPPEYVNDYFHKVGAQQKAIDKACGG